MVWGIRILCAVGSVAVGLMTYSNLSEGISKLTVK